MPEALDLAERALRAASGEEAEAVVQSERSGFARFAGSELHQPTLIENAVVQLRVVRDGRVGSALTNRTDGDGLAELARRATEAAELAPPDPHFPGLAPPEPIPDVEAPDEETAALGPADQAQLAAAAIEAARPFDAYGFFTSGLAELAVASTTGGSAYQAMTDAVTLVLAAADGASGYADATAWAVSGLDPAAVAEEAAAKAARTRGAESVEPGRLRAVLEPYAVAELLMYFAYDTFSALGLLEERSFFAGRLGEQVFDPKISIADDGPDPRGLPKAFDFEGVPKRRVQLVEDGVARGVVWDRTTAAHAGGGQSSTGHAPPPPVRMFGPLPVSLMVGEGEAASTEELAELVEDGIYVTRLHYLSIVHPREGVITGTTRDGTFRIRGGRIAEPLVNLRFTVAVPDLLGEVLGLTRERKLVNQSAFYDERYTDGVLTPGIATTSFNVTGAGARPGL